ncbi:MAG TPA: putative O-glycosylation ligase, exosortase A system-associated [Acetobacteraceae bacterium]|nr:putative O-glycosylation ligase, exosortase A system-associated [Acetobacteraceae bacterium]
MRDLLYVVSWLVFVVLAVQGGVDVGILLWTWTSLLSPVDVLYSFGTYVPFAKVGAGLTVLLLLAQRGGKFHPQLGLSQFLFLSLAGLAITAQVLSPAQNAAFGWDLCEKYLKVLLLGFVVMGVVRRRFQMHALIIAICLGLGFYGVDEGAKFLVSGGGHKVQGGSYGDNNQLAMNLLLMLPLCQHLYHVLKLRIMRLAILSGGVMCMFGVIATYSRGGFGGLAIIALASALASKRKIMAALLVVALAFGGLQVVGQAWVNRIDTIQDASDDVSFLGRVAAWQISTLVALDRPFGAGMHGIQLADIWFNYLPKINTLPLFPEANPAPYPHAAHSIWFEVLGDMGFGGLFCFVLLIFSGFVNARRTRRLVRAADRRDLEWAGDLALRLQISLLAFVASGSLLSAAYYDIDYLLFALIVVLRRHVEAELRVPQMTAFRGLPSLRWLPAGQAAGRLALRGPDARVP